MAHLLARHYGSRPQTLDFLGAPTETAHTLNDWIKRETRGRITNLVPSQGLSKHTRLAILGALHYQAKWESPMQTLPPRPFRRPGAEPTTSPMMGLKGSLPYRKGPNFSALLLPFRTEFDLLIVLPDEVGGLPALQRELTPAVFASLRDAPSTRVDLTLPPFRLSPPTLALSRPLLRLGLRSVFDDPQGSADFSRLAPKPVEEGRPAYLAMSDILQKAEFQIDRFGAEGSAGNVVPPGTKRGPIPGPPTPTPPPPVVVIVDHPFLFALLHRKSGVTLFVGRVEQLDAGTAARPPVPWPTPNPAGENGEVRELIQDFDAPELELDPDAPEP